MARIRDQIRPALDLGSRFLLSSVLVLVVGLTLPSRSQAAKLGQFLTPKDLSRPLLLDQNGTQLQLPSPDHPHPSLTPGSTPTYLALPLYGGEHLPAATATINAGAQAGGNAVGPLDFNSVVKGELNSALNTSGLALVDTPNQNYLVEYLPHIARSHQESAAGSGTTSKSSSTTSSSTSTLSKLLTASQWDKWANSGLSDLKKLLNIGSSSSSSGHSTSNSNIKIEAQVLVDGQTSEPGTVLPSPIPEPSGWMIFALLLGAAGLGCGLRRGQRLTTV
ncbi:MAG: hypothetical protein ACLQIB_28925 [Isosphaeraceae bacterium]